MIVIIGCVVALFCLVYDSGASKGNESETENPIEETSKEDQVEVVTENEEQEKEPENNEEGAQQNEKVSDDYFFPSDSVYITEADLYGKTKSEVGYMRNEIYARHGYMFKTEPYKTYFSQKTWYVPNPNFSESLFSAVEKSNKNFLVEYEKNMGWR